MSQEPSPSPEPGVEHRRLSVFVGAWNTEGEIASSPSGPAIRFHATDRYEWLPGEFFLVHRWDARMPDGDTQGIEIIGYDVSSKTYPMHSFDSHGQAGVLHATVEGDAWNFSGESVRFLGGFHDGNVIAGVWEQRSGDSASWTPWMEIRLTRSPRAETSS